MKILKNILFIILLGGTLLALTAALLMPKGFYDDLLYPKTHTASQPSSLAKPIKTTQLIKPQARDTQVASKPPAFQQVKAEPARLNSQVEVIEGMDWRLPSYAKRSKNGGLISETAGASDYVRGDFHIVRWDKTNPSSGQYNFTELQRALDRAPNQQILLRPEIYSRCEAPAWALKQLRHTQHGSLIFWDSQYAGIVEPFIKALANFVRKNPQVIGVQLGIGDGEYRGDCKNFALKDGWGEFNMNPQELKEAETNFGFTPEKLESSTKKIVNVFANAFGANVSKLVFNNLEQFSWNAIAEPYNQRIPVIAKYVLDKGIGARDGQVEHWMRYMHRILGMQVKPANNGTCSLDMDERVADRFSTRYWGTENEFYGDLDYVRAEHGSYQNQAYRFLISSLRGLQMRRNYSLIFARGMEKLDHPVYKTQEFLRYLDKTMGKLKNDTPDAFILLGERYVADYRLAAEYPERKACQVKDRVAFRSFGRWITETSDSKPAMRINMPASDKLWGQGYYLPQGIDYEYAARSSQAFSFNLNDQLTKTRCNGDCPVEVKVTYLDSQQSKLSIQTDNKKTAALATKGDGKLRTATFRINLTPSHNNQADFKLIANINPVNLMLLRVNFLQQ
ncbi:hypothetical protein [Leucothrix arctica]|uniref:Glycoside hydrolase family 42 N-terminal domain-containing protein n=1 Tax=Leucothrix arctica TaxID=1481894 RepID=A0A317CQB3_9GAMM|nr:hypothetical protein [Leucothrix arctica]PWQ98492.1 hypothetical protein DKT75_03305 [Leucothrix arctica]